MPKVTVFDRARGGLVDVDSAIITVSSYLRVNLDGTLTPTTNAADPLVLALDPKTLQRVAQRQLGAIIDAALAVRTRDPSKVAWESAGQVTLADLQAAKYGAVSDGAGGFIITGRNFRSDIPGTPAFRVKGDVQVKVLFKGCDFFGYGVQSTGGRGIVHGEYHNALAFDQCIWFSGKPPAGYPGAFAGKIVNFDTPSYFSFTNCEQYKCGGVYVRKFWSQAASGRTDPIAFYIGQSLFYDLDSRMVDNAGVWKTGSTAGTDFDPAGIVSIQNCLYLPGLLIEDFVISNNPVYGAQWEDVISYYRSCPAVGKTFLARRGLIENGYVYDQNFTGVEATHGAPGGSRKFYSGTEGNLGDGLEPLNDDGSSQAARSRDTVPNSFEMQDVTVLQWSNMGISINGGNRMKFTRVKALSVGAFRSSAPAGYTKTTGPTYALQVWDLSTNYDSNYTPGSGATALWGSHTDTDCVFGCWNIDGSGNLVSSASGIGPTMTYIPTSASLAGITSTNRTILATPASVAAALNLVDSYRSAQMAVFTAAGTILGVAAPAA